MIDLRELDDLPENQIKFNELTSLMENINKKQEEGFIYTSDIVKALGLIKDLLEKLIESNNLNNSIYG